MDMTPVNIGKKRSMGRNCHVEVSLDNRLDKDVQSMLLPLNLMQYVTCCPKYRIKDDFITPNSITSSLLSMFATIVFVFSFACRTYMMYCEDNLAQHVYLSSYYDFCYYSIGFIVNFTVGFVYTKKNITFVLNVQRINKLFKNVNSFDSIIVWNWITLISTAVIFMLTYIYFGYQMNVSPYFINSAFLVFFDINIVISFRMILLLEVIVIQWNHQMLNFRNISDSKMYYRQMFEAYVDILECYDIYRACFEHYILYYVIEIFIHVLLYFEVAIITLNQNIKGDDLFVAYMAMGSLYTWLAKNMLFQIILSQNSEKFYKAIENVQDTCAFILSSNCSDEKKKLCKNIQRLHRASFTKISACGLFYVDAALSVNLLSHLTNYIVVLLQFAYK